MLVISIQAIDTLCLNNSIYNTKDNKYHFTYNTTENSTNLKIIDNKYKKIILNYFVDIINYIFNVHNHIDQLLLSDLARDLVREHLKSTKSHKITKYLKKFHYIYFFKNDYYQKFKYIDYANTIDIEKVALMNLYLIAQLRNKEGIYILIKYLSNNIQFI